MPKKVLLVDDDQAVVKLLEAFLQSKGLEVETAGNGLEALESLKKVKPDIILVDVIMPKMDGYGFVRELKKDPQSRTLPLIVLTARETMRDIFVQEGVQDFITKPYDPEELYQRLAKYL